MWFLCVQPVIGPIIYVQKSGLIAPRRRLFYGRNPCYRRHGQYLSDKRMVSWSPDRANVREHRAFVLFGLGFVVSRLATKNKSEVRSQPVTASVLGRNPLFRPSRHRPTRTKVGGGAKLAPQEEPAAETGSEGSPRPRTAASSEDQGSEHRPPEP